MSRNRIRREGRGEATQEGRQTKTELSVAEQDRTRLNEGEPSWRCNLPIGQRRRQQLREIAIDDVAGDGGFINPDRGVRKVLPDPQHHTENDGGHREVAPPSLAVIVIVTERYVLADGNIRYERQRVSRTNRESSYTRATDTSRLTRRPAPCRYGMRVAQ